MELTTSGFMDPDEPRIIEIVTQWLQEGDDVNAEGYALHPEFTFRQSEEWEGWTSACEANVKPDSEEWKENLEQDRLEKIAWDVYCILAQWLSNRGKELPDHPGIPMHPEFVLRESGEWQGWNSVAGTKPNTDEWNEHIETDRLENIAWNIHQAFSEEEELAVCRIKLARIVRSIFSACMAGGMPFERGEALYYQVTEFIGELEELNPDLAQTMVREIRDIVDASDEQLAEWLASEKEQENEHSPEESDG